MVPLIGIAPGLDAEGRWRAGRETHYLDAAYPRAVSAAGGLPLLLAAGDPPERVLARLDGLLLPGGDDFVPPDPARYPEGVRFAPVPEQQLAFDRGLLRAALARDLPFLGICYGMQLLALELGGRLHYDVPHDAPEAEPHQLGDASRHPLAVEPGSRLEQVLGISPGGVNSRHHQAVADPGPKLRVSGRAGDGLVEAVELPDARFCLGVQWHPETMPESHRDPLFRAFVSACL